MLNDSTLKLLSKKLYRWFLPYHCILCNSSTTREQDLCQNCYWDFPVISYACQRCGDLITNSTIHCGTCLNEPPPFDLTHTLFEYAPPVSPLILNLKFHHALVNGRILGELLVQKIQNEWYLNKPLPEVIIPIPLHPKRLRERGFNQALEIARPISRKLSIPIDYKSCARKKATLPQATLALNERKINIKNAFTVTRSLSYRSIAVIDDVVTTGQTIREFCSILKKYGIEHIDVWCCARACV